MKEECGLAVLVQQAAAAANVAMLLLHKHTAQQLVYACKGK